MVGEDNQVKLGRNNILTRPLTVKYVGRSKPLQPCRWSLPSGSVASLPLVLLHTCHRLGKWLQNVWRKYTFISICHRSSYLAAKTSSITSSSSGCIVTSTLSDFWPRRRSTCTLKQTCILPQMSMHKWRSDWQKIFKTTITTTNKPVWEPFCLVNQAHTYFREKRFNTKPSILME